MTYTCPQLHPFNLNSFPVWLQLPSQALDCPVRFSFVHKIFAHQTSSYLPAYHKTLLDNPCVIWTSISLVTSKATRMYGKWGYVWWISEVRVVAPSPLTSPCLDSCRRLIGWRRRSSRLPTNARTLPCDVPRPSTRETGCHRLSTCNPRTTQIRN